MREATKKPLSFVREGIRVRVINRGSRLVKIDLTILDPTLVPNQSSAEVFSLLPPFRGLSLRKVLENSSIKTREREKKRSLVPVRFENREHTKNKRRGELELEIFIEFLRWTTVLLSRNRTSSSNGECMQFPLRSSRSNAGFQKG